ncbi:hypothetical protein GGX14DRAFT_555364 [Mycena pura]|uniref:Ribonuclease H1 N-terminal domain-containing protein n=1 Tax=Mycena pura TaxID=153505 RepID=A0AAD6YQV0_9AGAR|nr:hypothetical protein GGX14DRAFT_555364 [Mycena pura]
MAPHDLTPTEIAQLIDPRNHPARLSATELDLLTAHLSDTQLEQVVDQLGLDELARQLPPIFERVMLAAQRVVRRSAPESDDEVDSLIRHFDEASLVDSPVPTLSPSSAARPGTPLGLHGVSPIPTSPRTPQRATAPREYKIKSPQKVGTTTEWFEAGALTLGIKGASAVATGSRSRTRKPRSAAYVVFYGGEVGVFEDWSDVVKSITGHSGAIYSGFPSIAAATAALAYARSKGWTGDSTAPPAYISPLPVPSSYEDNPLHSTATTNRWYVVCRGVVPGVYRSYLECSLHTSGVKGNLYKAFDTREEAEAAYSQALQEEFVMCIPRRA